MSEQQRHDENAERAARWNSHQKSYPVSAPSVVENPGQLPELGPAFIDAPKCSLGFCHNSAEVYIEQSYKDGTKTVVHLCSACAENWVKGRPNTSRALESKPC